MYKKNYLCSDHLLLYMFLYHKIRSFLFNVVRCNWLSPLLYGKSFSSMGNMMIYLWICSITSLSFYNKDSKLQLYTGLKINSLDRFLNNCCIRQITKLAFFVISSMCNSDFKSDLIVILQLFCFVTALWIIPV